MADFMRKSDDAQVDEHTEVDRDVTAEAPQPNAVDQTPTASTPDGIPSGFQLRANGIYWYDDRVSEAPKWVWLCSPIRVIAMTRAPDSNGWGRLVELKDNDNNVKRWAIPARMFAGDGVLVREGLLDRGLQPASGRDPRNKLQDLIMQWQPKARTRTTERLGWADESCTAFALGDGEVIGDEELVYQSEHVPPAAREMRQEGTLEAWWDSVAKRCAGNPLLVLGVSTAFVGPLLEPLNSDSFGVHLRGPSSCGKSTILRVAVSVWGPPRFMFTWRTTSNGLEGIASACNATLLALDELGQAESRDAGAAVYMLGNNSGKTRATKAGHARKAAQWRVPALSSGEISLTNKLAEAGKTAKAGQDVRFLDIAADGFEHGAFSKLQGENDGAAFSDSMRQASAEHFGVAGRAFVEGYLQSGEGLSKEIRSIVGSFCELAEGLLDAKRRDGHTQRAVDHFALIAAAGEAATKMGLTGWEDGEATEAAVTALKLWLDGRGGSGPAEAREALDRVRAFIIAHGKSRFEALHPTDPATLRVVISNRAGWCDQDYFYIAPEAWNEIHAGSDPTRAARHLADDGHLVPEGGTRLKKKAPRSVPNRPRCYWVKASIQSDEDSDDA